MSYGRGYYGYGQPDASDLMQAGGSQFYNPYSKYPNWGAGISSILQQIRMMQLMKEQKRKEEEEKEWKRDMEQMQLGGQIKQRKWQETMAEREEERYGRQAEETGRHNRAEEDLAQLEQGRRYHEAKAKAMADAQKETKKVAREEAKKTGTILKEYHTKRSEIEKTYTRKVFEVNEGYKKELRDIVGKKIEAKNDTEAAALRLENNQRIIEAQKEALINLEAQKKAELDALDAEYSQWLPRKKGSAQLPPGFVLD